MSCIGRKPSESRILADSRTLSENRKRSKSRKRSDKVADLSDSRKRSSHSRKRNEGSRNFIVPERAPAQHRTDRGAIKHRLAVSSSRSRSRAHRLPPDAFLGLDVISSLNNTTFKSFLRRMGVSLVMFYRPEDAQCRWSSLHFKKAARTTIRENHAYASVNCHLEKDLCAEEQVQLYPTYKLYSRGALVGSFEHARSFLVREMVSFVENAPVRSKNDKPLVEVA